MAFLRELKTNFILTSFAVLSLSSTSMATGEMDAYLEKNGLNFTNRNAMKARKSVFVEAYTHDIADLADPAKSRIAEVVIDGWWKLIVPGAAKPDRSFSGAPQSPVLYDLKNDPLEKTDVSQRHPEEVARLKALLAGTRK